MSNRTANVTEFLSTAVCPPGSSNFLAQTGLYYIAFVVATCLGGVALFCISSFYYMWMRRFYERVLHEGPYWDSSFNIQAAMANKPPQNVQEPKGVGYYAKHVFGLVTGTAFLMLDVFFVSITFLKNLKPFDLRVYLQPLTDAQTQISGYNASQSTTNSNNNSGVFFWGAVIGFEIGVFFAALLWSIVTPYVLTWTFRLAYEPDRDLWEKHERDPKVVGVLKTIFNKIMNLLKKLPQVLCVKVLTFFLGYFSKQIVIYCIILPLVLFWPIGIPVVFMVLCCFTVQGFWISMERVKEMLGKRGVNLSRQFKEYIKGILTKVVERITQGNVNNGSENIGTEISGKLRVLFALVVNGFLPFCYVFAISMAKHVVKLWLAFPEPQILGVQPTGACKYLVCVCLWYKRKVNKEVDELMKTTPNAPPVNQDPNQFITVVQGPPPMDPSQQPPMHYDPSQPAPPMPYAPPAPVYDPSQPMPPAPTDAPTDAPVSTSDPAGTDETIKQEFEERKHEILKYTNMIPMIDWMNFTTSYTLGFMNVIPIIGPFIVLIGTTMVRSGFWLLPFWMFPELYKESDDPAIIPLRNRPSTIQHDFYKKLFYIIWEPFDPYAQGGQDSQKSLLLSLKDSSVLAQRWKNANEYGTLMVDPTKDYGTAFRMVMLCIFPMISLFWIPFPCGVDIFAEITRKVLY